MAASNVGDVVMRARTGIAVGMLLLAAEVAAEPTTIEVWKPPSCGCCGDWVEAMSRAGFAVDASDVDDPTVVRQLAGVPWELSSCHTATVDGYAIEGHVPADAIRRLLAERPDVGGLSAPGMPQGSPGMSGTPEPFDVIAFGNDGVAIWGTYLGAQRLD